MGWFDGLANIVDLYGTQKKFPELGVSEMISRLGGGSGQTVNTGSAQAKVNTANPANAPIVNLGSNLPGNGATLDVGAMNTSGGTNLRTGGETTGITGPGGGGGAGGGGGSTAPTTPAKVLPDRSRSIADAQAQLRGAEEQLRTGMAGIDESLANILSRYDRQANRYKTQVGESRTTAKNNLLSQIQAALSGAAQGRQGLAGTLASIGALSGSGIDLMNRAVQRGANMDITGANETLKESETALTNALNEFTERDEERRDDLNLNAENARINLRNLVDSNRQKAFAQLADDYAQIENQSEADRYSRLRDELYPVLGRSSVPANLAFSDVPFTLPQLANYVAGQSNMQVTAAPRGGGSSLPGLVALSSLRPRDRERETA